MIMRVIDNSRKIQPFFMEVGLGQTFIKGDRLYVKITEVCMTEHLLTHLYNYDSITDDADVEDIGIYNAYCISGEFFTHFDDEVPIELVECEIHIV
jgi:hypothetical protein